VPARAVRPIVSDGLRLSVSPIGGN